jgi:hypothetical protein
MKKLFSIFALSALFAYGGCKQASAMPIPGAPEAAQAQEQMIAAWQSVSDYFGGVWAAYMGTAAGLGLF